MFNLISRNLARGLVCPAVLACIVFAGATAAFAQVPRSTPRPTPAPGDPSRPPGTDPIPGTTTPAQNPSAPPGTQQTSPTAPPGSTVTPQATPPPTQPAGTVPGGSTEPLREPVIPQFQARPLPPVPSLKRLGVDDQALSLSMNDAIKRALENNNDIEVARDDVRFAETQLRALEGIFDPVFAITPTYDKRISPQQSSLGGGSVTSTTTYSWSPSVQKQFGKGGGSYFLQFQNSHTNTSNSFSLLNPFYSSNLSLQFTQPLLRDRSIDNNRRQIRIQRKRLDQSDADFRQRTIDVINRVQQAYWE
ncbi:MAG TPA: TolC family protein, partial [Pyrinomonadaceae bacterium]